MFGAAVIGAIGSGRGPSIGPNSLTRRSQAGSIRLRSMNAMVDLNARVQTSDNIYGIRDRLIPCPPIRLAPRPGVRQAARHKPACSLHALHMATRTHDRQRKDCKAWLAPKAEGRRVKINCPRRPIVGLSRHKMLSRTACQRNQYACRIHHAAMDINQLRL